MFGYLYMKHVSGMSQIKEEQVSEYNSTAFEYHKNNALDQIRHELIQHCITNNCKNLFEIDGFNKTFIDQYCVLLFNLGYNVGQKVASNERIDSEDELIIKTNKERLSSELAAALGKYTSHKSTKKEFLQKAISCYDAGVRAGEMQGPYVLLSK